MVLGCVQAVNPGTPEGPAETWWELSIAAAVVALVCGLSAKGRPATLALVVPSLVYLVMVFVPAL